jgi:hypothetical protein
VAVAAPVPPFSTEIGPEILALVTEASFKSVSKPIEVNEEKTSLKFFWKDTIEIQAKNGKVT